MEEFTGERVIILACSDCNAQCKHCYIGYSGNFGADELNTLCQEWSKHYIVTLNGTELLLHPEYFDVMQGIHQDFIITNGLEIVRNPDVAFSLTQIGIRYIGISYHFYTHEKISTTSKEIVKKAVSIAKAAGLKTDIRTTVSRENFTHVLEMCQSAQSWGADGIKFTNLLQAGRARKALSNSILSDSQIELFLSDVDHARELFPKDKFLIRRCGSFGPGHSRRFFCPAKSNQVVITPDLKVYPCIFLAQAGLDIGHVCDSRILINSEKFDGEICEAKERLNH